MVVTAPSRITSANNAAVRPRASRAARTAAPSKTYAARASSASTVTATRNSSTGATRSVTLTAPETGEPCQQGKAPSRAAASHTRMTLVSWGTSWPDGRGGNQPSRKVRAPQGRVVANSDPG